MKDKKSTSSIMGRTASKALRSIPVSNQEKALKREKALGASAWPDPWADIKAKSRKS